jgi:hypothetical protein
MKLTFDKIREHYDMTKKYRKEFPLIDKYLNREVDWQLLVDANLSGIANMTSTFDRMSNDDLDFALGRKTISFDELKEKLISSSELAVSKTKKNNTEDWQNCESEVFEVTKAHELILELTESNLQLYLLSDSSYQMIFPYLYRAEVNALSFVMYEFINYIITNGLEVNVEEYALEYFTELDYKIPTIKKLKKNVSVVDSVEQSVQEAILAIGNVSDPQNVDLYIKRLKKEIENLEPEVLKRNFKIRSVIGDESLN